MLQIFTNFLMIFGAISLAATTFSLFFFIFALRKASVESEYHPQSSIRSPIVPKKQSSFENNILPFKK